MNPVGRIKTSIMLEGKETGVSADKLLAISLIAPAITLVYALLLIVPMTRSAAAWALNENCPVELLSFFFAMAGGILGLVLAWQLRQHHEEGIVFWFYLVFAMGLLVIGGEEVAWGQWFFGFETPENIASVNTQGELTMHNHKIFNDHLEIFPLMFGTLGLIGVWLRRSGFPFNKICASRALLPWFGLIALISAIDLFQDFVVIQKQFDHLINYLDEVIEMMVAMAGFLYIWLNQKKFRFQWEMAGS